MKPWLKKSFEKIEEEVKSWPEWKQLTYINLIVVYQEREELPLTNFIYRADDNEH